METKPFFSILITSYNRPNYLEKCIRSILESDFKDFEIMISDDHSARIEEITNSIKPYLSLQNVTFVQQPHNIGMFDSWNFLVDRAKGRFVIGLGDDDKLHPDTLKKLKQYIDSHPDYNLYSFGYKVIDENDQFCYFRCSPTIFELSLERPKFVKSLFFADIIPFWSFHPFTMAYDRKIGEEIKYLKEAFIGADILFLFQCINKNKKMLVIPEVLFSWRKAQEQNKEYQNWSGPIINNAISRKKILNIIYQNSNLNPFISKLVFNKSYRNRFLYDPIISNKLLNEKVLNELNLGEEHSIELRKHYKSNIFFFHCFRIKLNHIYDYIKLFGYKGLFHVFLFFCHKFRYKIKKRIL